MRKFVRQIECNETAVIGLTVVTVGDGLVSAEDRTRDRCLNGLREYHWTTEDDYSYVMLLLLCSVNDMNC